MASKSMVMVSSLTEEVFEAIDAYVSDSDSWEVVEPSDSDDGNFSYGDVTSDDDDEAVPDVDDLLQNPYGSPSADVSVQSPVHEITNHCLVPEEAYGIDDRRQVIAVDAAYEIDDRRHVIAVDAVVEYDGPIGGAYDVDESEEDDADDLDDELVPKWLNNKFERQRMRKLGKRAYPKMKKSKRIAYQYDKPGCVHGKHGLGLKHNLC